MKPQNISQKEPTLRTAAVRYNTLPISTGGRSLVPYSEAVTVPVPTGLLERQRLLGAPGRGDLWDRFCVLRSRVLQILADRGWRTVGVTSVGRGEGKTWTAINLSIAISRQVGRTALLVDANLRRPAVHRRLNLDGDYGLASYLRDGTPLEQLMVHPEVGNLSVLAAGATMAESSDYFASERMHALVREVRNRYPDRVVVFDLPAISDGDAVLAMRPHVEALLLVVEEGVTQRDALTEAVESLDGAAIIGTVLNKARDDAD